MALTNNQRKLWLEKLMDLTNLSVGALVFGFLLSEVKLSIWIIVLGIFLYFLLSTIATKLGR